ncbi:MAG: hypothetical protein R3B06_15385 [Kofleriaceae bacterium]
MAVACVLPLAGCAQLLGVKPAPTAAQLAAAPEACFRSFVGPAQPPNARADGAVRAWYASLTPKVVGKLLAAGSPSEQGERVMAHAVAAGVSEAAFLRGEHPDPTPACGLGWRHEDVGDARFSNALAAARSVRYRAAFATCAATFDALWPRLATAAAEAARELAALPADADVYRVWSTYHRLMAAHAAAFPTAEERSDRPPVFAATGTPYLVWKDLMQRFGGGDHWYLAAHWLGGVSPVPDDAARLVQPIDASMEDARINYCAQAIPVEASPLVVEDVRRLSKKFDGVAWLEELPGAVTTSVHINPIDLSPEKAAASLMDRPSGRTKDDKATFRLYARTVSALKLTQGRGTIELTTVEPKRYLYACKGVVKIKQETEDTASITHEDQCKADHKLVTETFTLAVDALPPDVALAVGDRLVFYANRTATDTKTGSKPTKTGATSFSTTTTTADLVFLAQVQRGGAVVFPAPAYRP